MTTITQVITTLPTAPARSQAPATFITNADSHVAALSTLTSEINTWRGQANTVAGEVNANAVAAAADAVSTAADAVSTAADAIATAADRVQTGLDAAAASASAAAAASAASGFVGTSTTSLLIGTGSKTFTTQASEQYTAGIWVTATSQANPNNYMYGQVTSYSSTTLIVNVTKIGGSGTLADWNISLAGVQGEPGTGITEDTVGWHGTGGTTPKTLTVDDDLTTAQAARRNAANTFTAAQNLSRATVASHATTADIWGAAGNQIDWTGTATTTAFPNAPQGGATRTLICAGACSFTAGANMLIDGVASAATVTCAANDKMIVEALSTTQFKLSRVKYDGTAQVAAGGGAWVYLSTVTAAASATVDIETTFDSTYDAYVIVGVSITLSTTLRQIYASMKISGAYDTGGNYDYHINVSHAGSAAYGGLANTGASQIALTNTIGAAAGESVNLIMEVYAPAGTSLRKTITWRGTVINDATPARTTTANGVGGNTGTGALSGIRIWPGAGTLSGTFRLYGIKNS